MPAAIDFSREPLNDTVLKIVDAMLKALKTMVRRKKTPAA